MITMLLLAAALQAQPASAKTPAAARAVVERYYAAIDRGRYRTAYRLWARDGQASGKSYRAFAAGFARTRNTSVVAGASADGDAGAGSVFVTIPVRVYATLKDGARQRFTGSYVLRRVNDVDGSTLEQRRWHIESARLRAVR